MLLRAGPVPHQPPRVPVVSHCTGHVWQDCIWPPPPDARAPRSMTKKDAEVTWWEPRLLLCCHPGQLEGAAGYLPAARDSGPLEAQPRKVDSPCPGEHQGVPQSPHQGNEPSAGTPPGAGAREKGKDQQQARSSEQRPALTGASAAQLAAHPRPLSPLHQHSDLAWSPGGRARGGAGTAQRKEDRVTRQATMPAKYSPVWCQGRAQSGTAFTQGQAQGCDHQQAWPGGSA